MVAKAQTQLAEPQTKRWTREEFYQLAQQEWFANERVELIHGEIIQMPPHGHRHFQVLSEVGEILRKVLGEDYWVRIQGPLDFADSQPQPDVALVRGRIQDITSTPSTALLVVEVSDTTLPADRRKASLYASSAVPEYWIVNLADQRLEVYRSPVEDQTEEFRWRYGEMRTLTPSDTIAPLAAPNARIAIADFLK